jgi:tetratricopeptide (TPR) repeat protein
MARRVPRPRSQSPESDARPASPGHRRVWIPIAVLALALAVRVVVVLQLSGHPLLVPRGELDDGAYARLAARVASGDLLLAPEPYFLAPLYAYVLGALLALTGGSFAAARAMQALLGTAAVGFVMATATLWFGRRAGVIAGVLAALTGLFAFNEVLILQSAIDPFVTSLAVFLLARALQNESWARAAAAGAALGALALNRPNALLVIASVAVAWVAARRSKSGLLQAGAVVLGAAIVITPFTVRNRIVCGEWIGITSHGGLNFYIGNSPGADGTWHIVEGVRPSIEGQIGDVKAVASRALGRPVTATEASGYFYGLAWAWIRAHPGQWAVLSLRKMALVLNATDVGLNYSYTYFARDESGLLSALIIGPWILVPLGLFGLIAAAPRMDRPRYLVWAVVAPAYAVSVAAFFVSSRYRLALLVPLAVASGAGADWLWRAWGPASSRARALSLAGLAALAVFVNWPIVPDDGRQFERGERVLQLIGDGQVDQGLTLLKQTLPLHPDAGLLLYRVGLEFRERREPAQAIVYLRQAKTVEPAEPHIDLNLGEALLEAGQAAEAIPFLESARAANINLQTVTFDLVGAYHAVGQSADARRLLASIEVTPESDGRALTECGSAALELDDPVLAERFLRAAVARPEAGIASFEKLGAALALQGRSLEAADVLKRAVAMDPSDADARVALGAALLQAGRFDQARVHLAEALRLNPNHSDARRLLTEAGRKQ